MANERKSAVEALLAKNKQTTGSTGQSTSSGGSAVDQLLRNRATQGSYYAHHNIGTGSATKTLSQSLGVTERKTPASAPVVPAIEQARQARREEASTTRSQARQNLESLKAERAEIGGYIYDDFTAALYADKIAELDRQIADASRTRKEADKAYKNVYADYNSARKELERAGYDYSQALNEYGGKDYDQRVKAAETRLANARKAFEEQGGNPDASVVSAGLKGSAAGVVDTFGYLQELGQPENEKSWGIFTTGRMTEAQKHHQEVLAQREKERYEAKHGAGTYTETPGYIRTQDAAAKLARESAEEINSMKAGRGEIGQTVVDMGVQSVQMGADALAGKVLPGGSLTAMALRTFGSGVREARDKGANIYQQGLYGAGTAAVEVLTEKMFDGLAGVYGAGAADDIVSHMIGKITDNRLGQAALEWAADALGEGLEEVASDAVNPLLQTIFNGMTVGESYRENWDWQEVGYDFLIGALMGFAGGSVENVANITGMTAPDERSDFFMRAGQSGMSFKDATNTWRKHMIKEGYATQTSDQEITNQANEYLNRLESGKRVSERKINNLNQRATNTIAQEDIANTVKGVQQRMQQFGINDPKLAQAITALALENEAERIGAKGVGATEAQREMVEGNSIASRILSEMDVENMRREQAAGYINTLLEMGGASDEELQRNMEPYQRTNEWAKNLKGNKALAADVYGTQNTVTEAEKNAVTMNGESVKIVGAENGKVIVEQNGERQTVDAGKLENMSDSYKQLVSASPAGQSGEAFLRLYKPGQDVAAYAKAWDLAENMYGAQTNVSFDEARQRSSLKVLTDAQLQMALDIGRERYNANKAKAEERGKQLKQAREEAKKRGAEQRKKGTVSYDGGEVNGVKYKGIDKSKLSVAQKRVVAMVEALADAVNIDYVLFEGEANTGGSYIQGGTVYINIKAGEYSGKTLGAATLSHELTHFLQDFAPEEYQELKDFLIAEILKQSPAQFEKLVQKQLMLEPDLNYDQATDEMIANACQKMLLNSEAVTKLARQNMNLAEKIRDAISEISDKIKAAFEDVDMSDNVPVFEAARSIENVMDKAQALWDKALEAATENYNAAQATGKKISAGKGGVQFSIQRTRTLPINKQLSEYRKGKFSTADEFYFGATPSQVAVSGFNSDPLVMSQEDFTKSKKKKHDVPDRVWKRVPEILADPIFAFEYGQRAGFLTKDIDAIGQPLVIGLAKGKVFHEDVNRVHTAFGLTDAEDWISRAIQAGARVRFYDVEQANTFLHNFGYEAEEAGSIRSGDIVTLKKLGVKTQNQILSAEYAEAVENNDMDKAAHLVNQAAKDAGAILNKSGRGALHLYHGTPSFGFTEFRPGMIFLTDNKSIAAGYTQNKGYGRPRQISEAYTPDDGTDKTLIKNLKNVLGHNYREVTDADVDEIREEFRTSSGEMSEKVNDVWDGKAMDALHAILGDEYTQEFENKLYEILALPGYINEWINEIFENPTSGEAEDIKRELERHDEYYEDVRKVISNHNKELRDSDAKDLRALIMGYDLSDFLIDAQYKMIKALDADNMLMSVTGSLVSKELLRQDVEQTKDVGAYDLYGFAGDNPLEIDGKGAFWTNIEVPELGGVFMTDEIARRAKEQGYTSVIIHNIMDSSMNEYAVNTHSDVYVFFNSEQVKSADPVTYDDNGNVVPLEERFNSEKKDIRYQKLGADELQDKYDSYINAGKELQAARKQLSELKNSEEYDQRLDKIFKVSKEERDKTIEDFNDWQKKAGIVALDEKVKTLQKEYDRLRKEYDAAALENEKEQEREAIEKSGKSEADYFRDKAVKEFGYTPYYYDAGYIVPNGKMLNFSGEKGKHYGSRGQDHRAIGTIFTSDFSGSEAMLKFMSQGNIRIMAETPGIDINSTTEPTKEQYAAIRRFASDSARKEYFNVDFTDERGNTVGSIEYEDRIRPDRVINDIKHFYATGEVREQGLSQFYQKLGIGETAEEQEARKESFDNLKAENKILRARAEYWKAQMRTTKERTVRQQDTDRLAREMLKKYESRADKAEVKAALKELGDWLVQAEELDYDELYARAETIAEDIISGNYALLDNSQQGNLDRLKDYLKNTPVNLSKSDFRDTGDEGFRKKYGRYFTVSERGRTIDSLWGEMAAMFGEGVFPEDVYAPGDMLNMIADYLDMWKPQYGNEFELFHDEAVNAATNEIIDAILSEDVRQTPATYADKAQQKLNSQIAKDRERLDALREAKNARIEELKRQASEKNAQIRLAEKAAKYEAVSKVKQHYQDMLTRQRNKRGDTKVRAKIKKLHKELSDILLKPKEGRYVPRDLVKATAEILGAVDTTSGRAVKAKAAMAELKVKYDALAKDQKYALTYDETVSGMLQSLVEELGDGSIYDLTGTQLEGVYNVLKSLKHTIVTANKLVGAKIEADAFEAANEMMHETESAKGIPNKMLRRFVMAQLTPSSAFRMFGGYKKNSMWEQMFHELNNGQLTQTQILMEGGQIFRELIDDKKNMAKLHDQKNLVDIGLKDDQGNAIKVTRGMMLSVYMHLLNEQNAKHVAYGGLTVPRLKQYYKNQMKDAFNGKTGRAVAFATEIAELNEQLKNAETVEEQEAIKERLAELNDQTDAYMSNLRAQIEEQLTDYDRKWIAAAQEFFDVYSKGKLNEVTEMVYGFEKAQVDNYFPIHTDPDYRAASFDTIVRDMNLENAGFMKERVNGANPILLEDITDVISSQLRRTAQYVGLMPAIRNFNKVYGKARAGYSMSVQSAMARTFENEGKKYIENLMADLNGARKGEPNSFDELRGRMAGAVLTLNPRVTLSQAASFPSAAAEIGYKPLMKALTDMKNPMWDKGLTEEIAKWTPLWWYRMQGFSTTELGDIKNNEQFMAKVMDKMKWATGWIQAADGLTTGGLWQASKYYVDDNFSDLKKGSDEYMMKVAEVYNRVLEKTQPDYTTMQRPDILRNPNDIVKQLTMFMTQRLQNTNILYDAAATYSHYVRDAEAGRNGVTAADVKQARTRLAWAVSSQVAAGATIVIFKAIADAIMHNLKAYRDDDDELTAESVSRTLLTNFIETLSGNILWGSEIFSWTKSAITGERYYGVSLNGVDTFKDVLEDCNKLVQKAIKGDVDGAKSAGWKLFKAIGQFFGAPLANGEKFYNMTKNYIEDAQNGTFMEAGVDRTRAQNTHLLFNALQSGDGEKATRIRATFKDKKDEQAALKSYIQELYTGKDQKIQKAETVKLLQQYAGMTKREAEDTAQKWTMEVVTGYKFSNLQDDYISGEIPKAKAVKFYQTYSSNGRTTQAEAEAKILEWTCEKDTGIAYSDIGNEVKTGRLSKDKAIQMVMKYGGKDENAATKTVNGYLIEHEYDITPNELEDEYLAGNVSDEEALDILERHRYYGKEEAEKKATEELERMRFVKANPDAEDISVTQVRNYQAAGLEGIVSASVYADAAKMMGTFHGVDADDDGKTDRYSIIIQKLEYIDTLDLTPEQKTRLAQALGISDKNIRRRAPWR